MVYLRGIYLQKYIDQDLKRGLFDEEMARENGEINQWLLKDEKQSNNKPIKEIIINTSYSC